MTSYWDVTYFNFQVADMTFDIDPRCDLAIQ